MALAGIFADADDYRINRGEVLGQLSKLVGFYRAPGGIILGIKIQDDVLFALVIGQIDELVILVG